VRCRGYMVLEDVEAEPRENPMSPRHGA
jgi:hypothetical protein